MQLCMLLLHIVKFCSLFCIFLTSQSDFDFEIALVYCPLCLQISNSMFHTLHGSEVLTQSVIYKY